MTLCSIVLGFHIVQCVFLCAVLCAYCCQADRGEESRRGLERTVGTLASRLLGTQLKGDGKTQGQGLQSQDTPQVNYLSCTLLCWWLLTVCAFVVSGQDETQLSAGLSSLAG